MLILIAHNEEFSFNKQQGALQNMFLTVYSSATTIIIILHFLTPAFLGDKFQFYKMLEQ